MGYIENPKTRGSGIYAAIPQKGVCPQKCGDCFFQSGRSYLEPLKDNLPNMPPLEEHRYDVIRVNDGNDSNNKPKEVMKAVKDYPMKFYNTSIPKNLEKFDAPVVLTLNPAKMTDKKWHKLKKIPPNLMFVRYRTNVWNLDFLDEVINYYASKSIPIILTFMRYYTLEVPEVYKKHYIFKKKITNSYWVINDNAWKAVIDKYDKNKWVYACSRDGESGWFECSRCGHCIREYFVTRERMKGE